MNIFAIYSKNAPDDSEPIIIRQGFSVIAGIFNLFWAAYHRMWLVAFITLVINFSVCTNCSNPLLLAIAYAVNFAIFFLFAFFGSEMREYYATKKGYVLVDIVTATSLEEAEMKYIMRQNEGKGAEIWT